MKKTIFFLTVFMMPFLGEQLFSFSNNDYFSLNSQTLPTKIQSNTGGGGGGTGLFCNIYENYTLQVANLDLLTGIPCTVTDEGNLVPFPDNLPELYVQFWVGDLLFKTVHVDYLEPARCSVEDDEPSIYQFNYFPSIHNGFLNELYNTFAFGTSLDVISKLVTPDSEVEGGYAPYPICDHLGPGNLFDCTYFEDTEPFCPGTPGIGPGLECEDVEETLTTHFLTGFTIKAGCFKGWLNSGTDRSNESISKDNLNGTLVKVTPNPFHQSFAIFWEEEAKNATIHLYDLSGKRIKSISSTSYQKEERTFIETVQLPKGIYFLAIKSENSSEYVKLIRQ